MPGGDWFSDKLNDIPPQLATFSAQATATGTTHNLSAGDVAQAALDSTLADLVVTHTDALKSWSDSWFAWRDELLFGDPLAPMPTQPPPPTLALPDEDFLPGIVARHRKLAGQVKGAANYTTAIGEDYGIVAPAPGEPAVPAISKATPLVDFDVALKLSKAGYAAVAVDMRRGGGAWTQIGVSLTATFVDETAPLEAGVPEVREYRVQGMEGNARVGDLSAVASAVAAP